MPKVLVTGMSGTGKSAVLQELGERGHRVVDTDTDQWSRWVTLPDGSPDWIWREDAIKPCWPATGTATCSSRAARPTRASSTPSSITSPCSARLPTSSSPGSAARTSNPYGKHPAERAQILRDLAEVEPLLRATATIEIDASAPTLTGSPAPAKISPDSGTIP